MPSQIDELYGNRLRLRACGVLVENGRLLMVNHSGLRQSDFWAPPGGGVDFGESVPDGLVREFREETGLETRVGDFLFACEFIHAPLHAIELFFMVHAYGGKLGIGLDPEMKKGSQIIRSVRFMTWEEIQLLGPDALHGIFRFAEHPAQVTGLRGYFKV